MATVFGVADVVVRRALNATIEMHRPRAACIKLLNADSL